MKQTVNITSDEGRMKIDETIFHLPGHEEAVILHHPFNETRNLAGMLNKYLS